jgi:hypothetical protein
MYLVSVSRPLPRRLRRPGQWRAHGVHARHERASIGAEHVDTRALPMRVMILVLTHHIGAVGAAQRRRGRCASPARPMLNGITYMVRPCMATVEQRLQVARISSGSTPVVGGAGVLLVVRADVGAVFHAGHVAGDQTKPGKSWGAWQGCVF